MAPALSPRWRAHDIIVFHFPLDSEEHVVKRVIGVPGDEVALQNGVAVVNKTLHGLSLTMSSSALITMSTATSFRVTQLTIQGSIRIGVCRCAAWSRMLTCAFPRTPTSRSETIAINSRDSRYWGFVPHENIEGSPLLIYFSLREPSATDAAPMRVVDSANSC